MGNNFGCVILCQTSGEWFGFMWVRPPLDHHGLILLPTVLVKAAESMVDFGKVLKNKIKATLTQNCYQKTKSYRVQKSYRVEISVSDFSYLAFFR